MATTLKILGFLAPPKVRILRPKFSMFRCHGTGCLFVNGVVNSQRGGFISRHYQCKMQRTTTGSNLIRRNRRKLQIASLQPINDANCQAENVHDVHETIDGRIMIRKYVHRQPNLQRKTCDREQLRTHNNKYWCRKRPAQTIK